MRWGWGRSWSEVKGKMGGTCHQGFGDKGGLRQAFQLRDPCAGGRPLLPLRAPPRVCKAGGLSLSGLGCWVRVRPLPQKHPHLGLQGLGHRELWVLRAPQGPGGPRGTEQPRVKPGRRVGRAAGILGNPLGQYPQGALHSAGKQPAFQESLWGGGREDCGGSQASPGLGPHFKGLPGVGGLGVHRQ